MPLSTRVQWGSLRKRCEKLNHQVECDEKNLNGYRFSSIHFYSVTVGSRCSGKRNFKQNLKY